MKLSLLNPKIDITSNLSKLINDLDKLKIKYIKKEGIIYFKAKILENLPEFIVNVRILNGEVYHVELQYNYTEEEKNNAHNHREILTNHIFRTYGKATNSTLKDNQEKHSWIDKKEYLIYKFNGPDFRKSNYIESDIYLQFIFKQEQKYSTTQLKKLILLYAVLITVVFVIYYIIKKDFDFWDILISLGIMVGSSGLLYFFTRFVVQGDLYSPREERVSKKYFDKFESENEVYERFEGLNLYITLFFEKFAYAKIYFTKDKVIILYMPYVKMHKIEIPYSSSIKLESNKNVVKYKVNNKKRLYFLMPNELIAEEVIRTYKKYRGK